MLHNGVCIEFHGIKDPPTKRQRLVSPKWSPSRELQKKLQESEAEAQQKVS